MTDLLVRYKDGRTICWQIQRGESYEIRGDEISITPLQKNSTYKKPPVKRR